MQSFAENQRLTQIVNATRAYTLGDDAERILGPTASYFATRSVLWCALFIVVLAPLAARRYSGASRRDDRPWRVYDQLMYQRCD